MDNIGHIPTRSFRTSQDYASPIRQRLLDVGDKVTWTEGPQQQVIADTNSIESIPGGHKRHKKLDNNDESNNSRVKT